MSRRPERVLLLLAVGVLALAPSWALDPQRPLRWAKLDSWTKRDGLPTQGINLIRQFRDGYLWMCTEQGLVRFDGLRFVTFDRANVPALRASWISDALEFPSGTVLVATFDGLYRKRGNSWLEITALPRGTRYNALLPTTHGTILAIHSRGVLEVTETDATPYRISDGAGRAPDIAIVHAQFDTAGVLWVIADNGHRLLRIENQVAVEHKLTATSDSVLSRLAKDSHGRIWLAGETMPILVQNGDQFEPVISTPPLPQLPVDSLSIDRHDATWIGFRDGGIGRIYQGKLDRLSREMLLGTSSAINLAFDDDGSLWYRSSLGLARLRDAPIAMLSPREGAPGKHLTAVLADSRGRLWVGAYGTGLARLENSAWRLMIPGSEAGGMLIPALAEDSQGSVWYGTVRAGFGYFANGEQRVSIPSSRDNDVILALTPEPNGTAVLLGAASGAWRATRSSLDRLPFVADGELSPSVGAVLIDRNGVRWAGTFSGQIFFRQHDSWKQIALDPPLSGQVLTLFEDPVGAIWAGTTENGLLRIRDRHVTRVDRRHGLPNDTVYGIALGVTPDEVWVSYPDGIYVTSLQALHEAADGERARIEVERFGVDEGLRPGETVGGGTTLTRAPDGTLYFATTDGVAMIDPRQRFANDRPPRVVIESLVCDGVEHPIDNPSIRLPAGTARCEARFSVLNLRAPARVRSRYRIHGLDPDWTDAADSRVVAFTSPPAGELRLQVIAANESGVWNDEGASLSFQVVPHFWQTWTFATSIALLLAALGYAAHRLRTTVLVRRQSELERVVTARTNDLAEVNRTLESRVEEGIAKLREAERFAAYGQMVAAVAHEVRHPIFAIRTAAHLIGIKSPQVSSELAEPLSIMQRETERMSRLTDDLLQFAKPPALVKTSTSIAALIDESIATVRAGEGWDAIAIESDCEPLPHVTLDKHRMLQVLVNLLENARKHAQGITRVTIHAQPQGDHLQISVVNDGRGIAPEVLPQIFQPFFTRGSGTGLGLPIVHRIVNEHGGTLVCHSQLEHGAEFVISLPLT